MKCPFCGKETSVEGRFCEHCGRAKDVNESVVQEQNVNGIAIAGFTLSFFMPLLGLIFAIKGKKRQGKGTGLWIPALILSILGLPLRLLFFVMIVMSLFV